MPPKNSLKAKGNCAVDPMVVANKAYDAATAAAAARDAEAAERSDAAEVLRAAEAADWAAKERARQAAAREALALAPIAARALPAATFEGLSGLLSGGLGGGGGGEGCAATMRLRATLQAQGALSAAPAPFSAFGTLGAAPSVPVGVEAAARAGSGAGLCGAAAAPPAKLNVFLTGLPGVGKSTLVKAVLDALGALAEGGAMARAPTCGFWTREVRGGSGRREGFDCVLLGDGGGGGGSDGGEGGSDGGAATVRLATALPSLVSASSDAGVTAGASPDSPSDDAGASSSEPRVGKYRVHVDAFAARVLPALSPPALATAAAAAAPGGGGGGELSTGSVGGRSRRARLCVLDEVGKMELLCVGFGPAVERLLSDETLTVLGTMPAPGLHASLAAVEAFRSRPDVDVIEVKALGGMCG